MMNKDQIMDAMGFLDPALIEGADQAPIGRKRRGWARPGMIAACLCLALAGTALAAELSGVRVVDFFNNELWDVDGQIHSGYVLEKSGTARFPLDGLSPELVEWAQSLKGAEARSFRSWKELEEYAGISLMDNPVLDGAPAGGSYELAVPGGKGSYLIVPSAADGMLGSFTFYSKYRLHDELVDHKFTSVHVSLEGEVYTEQYEAMLERLGGTPSAGAYYMEGTELAHEVYTAPSGLTAQIFQVTYPEEAVKIYHPDPDAPPYAEAPYISYLAAFCLNGIYFEVKTAAENSDPGRSYETLLEILDGFVVEE